MQASLLFRHLGGVFNSSQPSTAFLVHVRPLSLSSNADANVNAVYLPTVYMAYIIG